MNTKTTKTKRDRNKVMRVRTERNGMNDSLKQRKVRFTDEEDAMLQYILEHKMVGDKKISMRDFFAACIKEEYDNLKNENK